MYKRTFFGPFLANFDLLYCPNVIGNHLWMSQVLIHLRVLRLYIFNVCGLCVFDRYPTNIRISPGDLFFRLALRGCVTTANFAHGCRLCICGEITPWNLVKGSFVGFVTTRFL